MGLLDDAIRDHLELKRLRGADPGEVAREQREALEPDLLGEPGAVRDTPATAVEDPEPDPDRGTMPVRATPAVMAESHEDSGGTPQIEGADADSPSDAEETTPVAEETVELDMRTVMEEPEAGSTREDSFDGAGPATGAAPVEVLNEDQLEWEVPGESSAGTSAEAKPHDRAVGGDGR